MRFDWFSFMIHWEDRRIYDVSISNILLFHHINQIDSMLPQVCEIEDHSRRKNVVRTSAHDTIGCTSCDLLLNKCTETWNRFVTWINSFSDQCHFSLILKTLDSSLSNCSCVVRRSRRITSSSARTVSPSETRPLLMTSSAREKNRNLKTAFIVPWYNVKH